MFWIHLPVTVQCPRVIFHYIDQGRDPGWHNHPISPAGPQSGASRWRRRAPDKKLRMKIKLIMSKIDIENIHQTK